MNSWVFYEKLFVFGPKRCLVFTAYLFQYNFRRVWNTFGLSVNNIVF